MIISRYIPDSEIEASAMRLIQRYGLQRHPILVPPVPVEEIIEHVIDMSLIWDNIPDCDGTQVLAKIEAYGQPEPRITLVMNEDKQLFFDQHIGVEQFSEAHELGHYVLHIDHAKLNTLLLPETTEQSVILCRAKGDRQSDQSGRQREWQAERFAAYLLMPQDLVRSACRDMDLCQWKNLYLLKEQFCVSISALTRRLTDMHLITIREVGIILPYQERRAIQSSSLWE